MRTVLIGFGDIAPKHLEVLNALNCEIIGVFARNHQKLLMKTRTYNLEKTYKSIDDISDEDFDFFTILVSPENNAEVLEKTLSFKKPTLIEKPVSFSSQRLGKLIETNQQYASKVMVAVNRRFYSIFHSGLSFLKERDKKVDSVVIEAPERFSDINLPKFSEIVRKNWMFCNSIHCVDLIRFFCGNIKKIEVNSKPEKYIHSAIGTSEQGVEFTYISNWKSPGSWSVRLYADDMKIVYDPLEKGTIINKYGKKEINPSAEDVNFKPGFYNQLSYFMNCVSNSLDFKWPSSNLIDHKNTLALIEEIYKVKNP
ncbi:MAG: Gfo/Idh/MocA family oxidoreductase [Nitrosopumilaceae archaeon]